MEKGNKGSRLTRVKNKTPNPIQITAEQLLREAQDRIESDPKPPRQKITDPEELAEYQLRKRKGFEDNIRRNKSLVTNWLKYAKWEESQREFVRARSIFERALDLHGKNTIVWLKYAEMEMRNKFINHARNVWDRAVILLPRVDQLWYKYEHMEDMAGNFAGARQIFERWMEWHPDKNAWNSYIQFEIRNGEFERVENIFSRFVNCHPTVKSWMKWAKYHEKNGRIQRAREIYQQGLDVLGEEAYEEKIFIAFANLEVKAKEFERARAIYKFALDHIPKNSAQELYKIWIGFEKQHGDKDRIEDVIIGKRRFQYEEEIKTNSHNYDTWFDYTRLEEMNGDIEKTREIYERAIANIPPINEKRYWRRYIYLWINYAIFEELEAKDIEKTRQVYKEALRIIPHKQFSFSKIWLMFARFEIRQQNLDKARLVFGQALGIAENEKIYKAYIDLESKIGNIDRCRILYQKYLEFAPSNCQAWCKFAELEKTLSEFERTRAIFELAIEQPTLDMPETVWKAFIDFEIEQEEFENTRKLYERLLERTKHVKVWISYAQFEISIDNYERARQLYQQSFQKLKDASLKEERVMLVESWKEFEESLENNANNLSEVLKKMPERIKKKRQITVDGVEAGWEEYYDYIFPDEKDQQQNLKLLRMAHLWKKQKTDHSQSEF